MITEQQADSIIAELREVKKILRLNLLTVGGALPTTRVENNFFGDTIGTTDKYVQLYQNTYNRLLALKITAEFAIPGSKASISLTNNPSNTDRVALLSSTGPVISDTLWVPPGQTLYINTADTAFTLAGSVFRTLVFDPLGFDRASFDIQNIYGV